MTAERIDPLLGRPLTASERSALNALMHELDLCKAAREAHPIVRSAPAVFTEAETQALRAVRFRVDHGMRPSRYPAGHDRTDP